jgi:hypothetical protein
MMTAVILRQRLHLGFDWYQGMVNPRSGMLEYLYIPQTDEFFLENCPIRDIASVWDAELLGEFLDRQELRPMIAKSLRHFGDYIVRRGDYLILDSDRLAEPSSIAHSAFMMLALLHAPPPQNFSGTQKIKGLANGIVAQQRADGSYKVCFEDVPDHGEELYAGEAMLGLLEAYRQLHDTRYLQSAERAFAYYDSQYFQRGYVSDDLLIFFANWQSQACRLLFQSTPAAALRRGVARFIFHMHDQIVENGFYRDVERRPEQQVSVEVACALEGLNDAYAVACNLKDHRANLYRECICTGLEYLLNLQRVAVAGDDDPGWRRMPPLGAASPIPATTKERGGFGISLSERAQRIDITGHAASAFMKSIENAIECGQRK